MESNKRNFTGNLEDKARDLVRNMKKKGKAYSVDIVLLENIALILDQIEGMRNLQEEQMKSLLRTECYVDTELLQMRQREYNWRYAPVNAGPQFGEKDRLHQRLAGIDAERGKHTMFYEIKLQELQRRLLGLMQRHKQMDFNHSH